MRYFLVVFLGIMLASTAIAADQDNLKGWPLILKDYHDGLITANEKAHLALTLLNSPQSLPSRYQIDKPMKGATAMILDILTDKEGRIDPNLLDQYNLLLTRVTTQAYYDTPEGHFRIHYDTTGSQAVYLPGTDVDPADGVPDFVNRTGEYFERAWTFQTDTLGYDTPPYDGSAGGGTDLYDIYMHHYSGAYGVTFPENYSSQRPNRNSDMTSYIYVDPTYAGFGYGDRTLPMKVTSGHEFFHAVQFAYNANAGGWFMENCSTWMEETMWDDINDCYAYMPYFFNNTNNTLWTYNGSFEYGAFVWPTYIEERYGRELIRTIWEWSIQSNAQTAVLAVLDEYASGFENDFPEFCVWNYLTGARNDGNHYSEGSSYAQVRIMRTHTTYPVNNNTSYLQPQTVGCNYVLFARAGNSGNLVIHFDGGDAGDWVVPVVKSIATNQHEFDMMTLDNNGQGDYIVRDFENYVGVAIIPILLYGPSSNYTYSAELDTVTSINETPAELPEEFKLLGNYPNPFNSRTILSFDVPQAFAGNASISIYDPLGREIKNISVQTVGGLNEVPLTDFGVDNLASGLYFYMVTVGNQVLTGKMTYLK